MWRGLAQIAVGLTHARRGNARGAVTLLRRGAAGVRGFAGDPPGIDAGLRGRAARTTSRDRIERDGLAARARRPSLRLFALRPGGSGG